MYQPAPEAPLPVWGDKKNTLKKNKNKTLNFNNNNRVVWPKKLTESCWNMNDELGPVSLKLSMLPR